MPIRLNVLNTVDGTTKSLEFDQETLNVGRGSGADLVLPDGAVSDEHAQICFHEGQWCVQDTGSLTGTRFNGYPLEAEQPVLLSAGDVLTLGPFDVQFELLQAASEASAGTNAEPAPRRVLLGATHTPIPLEGVRVRTRVSGVCQQTTVVQRYVNCESQDLEIVYTFPLEEGAAVCGFSAQIGERLAIHGQVEERGKAFDRYDEAMAQGHGAFLLDQERPNVFTASIGNLRPGETVEIRIVFVALLRLEGSVLRLVVPSTVSPRYTPAELPEGAWTEPPLVEAAPYRMDLEVELSLDTPIASIESPSHDIHIAWLEGSDGRCAVATLASQSMAMDRDFVLLVRPCEPHRPRVRVVREADGAAHVAMVTFLPDVQDEFERGSEVLFVLDCSGSMSGESIAQARRALALCVRSLQSRDTFNIVRFGDRFEALWPVPRPFDPSTLALATEYIARTEANLGGTEILRPLRHVLDQPPDAERFRQVLLLTDGQVSNEAEVIALCRHAATARVLVFGIGAGINEHFVRGVARASRGEAELIHPGERIEPKVLRMFARVQAPVFRSLSVDWGQLQVQPAPQECPPLFPGEPLTVFGRITAGTSGKVVLRADEEQWALELDLERAEDAGPIPLLWARQAIADLELRRFAGRPGSQQPRPGARDRTAERLVELGIRYGLVSSATSYVAIEQRTDSAAQSGPSELRRVPLVRTHGWGGQDGSERTEVVASAFLSKNLVAFCHEAPDSTPYLTVLSGNNAGLVIRMPDQDRPIRLGRSREADWILEDSSISRLHAELLRDSHGVWLRGLGPTKVVLVNGAPIEGSVLLRSGAEVRLATTRLKFTDPQASMPAARAGADSPASVSQPGGSDPSASVPASASLVRPPEEELGAGDRLFELLLTQTADGSFPLSAALRRWLGAREAAVAEAAARQGEALVATAVVLALLEREEPRRSDEWSRAAAKAVGSSRVDLQACKLEYSIVSPK